MISITTKFRRAHAVKADPNNAELHEHDWTLEVIVDGPLRGPGWVMDFAELRRITAQVLPKVGSFNAWLCDNNATAERIAERIFDQIRRRLPPGVHITLVVLEEDPGNRVYWP